MASMTSAVTRSLVRHRPKGLTFTHHLMGNPGPGRHGIIPDFLVGSPVRQMAIVFGGRLTWRTGDQCRNSPLSEATLQRYRFQLNKSEFSVIIHDWDRLLLESGQTAYAFGNRSLSRSLFCWHDAGPIVRSAFVVPTRRGRSFPVPGRP